MHIWERGLPSDRKRGWCFHHKFKAAPGQPTELNRQTFGPIPSSDTIDIATS